MTKLKAIILLITSRYFVVFTCKDKKSTWRINAQLDEVIHKKMAEGLTDEILTANSDKA